MLVDGFYRCAPSKSSTGHTDEFFGRFGGFSATDCAHYRARKMLRTSVEGVDESLLAVDSDTYGKIFIPSTNKLASVWTGLPADRAEPPFLASRVNRAIVDAAKAHGRSRQAEQR